MKNDLQRTISKINESSSKKFNLRRLFIISTIFGLGVPVGWFILKSLIYSDFTIERELSYYLPLYIYLSIYSPTIIYIIGRFYIKYIRKFEFLSLHDPLTGLYNRRYLGQQLDVLMEISDRYETEFSVVITDIDFFKQVNDKYGHDCGDMILKELSKLFVKNIRKIDFVGRYGGEEFLILLPSTTRTKAIGVAENLRKIVETHQFRYDNIEVPITVSAGVAAHRRGQSVESLMKTADENLYTAKNSGRNCVV
ncbi:MAG: GGDEF domain-containing protein [Calditrichaeota bacterium]|nr:GGDEF domain-containing protein [Calditrichota bacterium]